MASKKYSRWEMAKIKATLKANQSMIFNNQQEVDAQLKIEKEIEGKKSNVIVEELTGKPKIWNIIKEYFSIKVK